MAEKNPVPLRFPIKGINENAAYAAQNQAGAVRADHVLNVRAHDPLERRARGGRRTGISKVTGSPVASAAVQSLSTITEAVDLIQNAGFGEQVSTPNADLDNGSIVRWSPDGTLIARATTGTSSTGDGVFVYSYDGSTVALLHQLQWGQDPAAIRNTIGGTNGVAEMEWSADGTHLFVTVSDSSTIGAWPYSPDSGFGTAQTLSGAADVLSLAVAPDGQAVFYSTDGGDFLYAVAWTGTAFGGIYSSLPSAPNDRSPRHCLRVNADSDLVVAAWGAFSTWSLRAWEWSSATGWGAAYADPSGFLEDHVDSVAIHPQSTHVLVQHPSADRVFTYPFDKATGWGTPTDQSLTTGPPQGRFSPDGQHIILGLGGSSSEVSVFNGQIGANAANSSVETAVYSADWRFDKSAIAYSHGGGAASNNGLSVWRWQTAGTNPSARRSRVVAVAAGSVYRSDADGTGYSQVSGGSGALRASGRLDAAVAFQNLFFADGASTNYQYLDFADNTLKDWSDNLNAGSLPAGTDDASLGADMIAVYRGRVVLAGLKEEPQNWFMSKAGDPFDFNYSPATPNATQAVAGNNSTAGELGDILTALIPFQDDVLIFGGVGSIWMLRGDPAAGGQIDNVSRRVGVAHPLAWTFDPAGVLYFMGQNGLYRLAPGGGAPESISSGRMDRTFQNIDYANRDVRLVYDHGWQGVHIFISPVLTEADQSLDQFFWDQRTDSFWRDQYPTHIGPSAVERFEADNPADRALLMGGFDGHVRRFDDAAGDDDGTSVVSFARFPALHPGVPMAQFRMSDLQIHTDSDGAGPNVNIYRAATPEQAAAATGPGVLSKALTPGRNVPIRKRVRGNAIQMRIELNGDEQWAYENGTAVLEGVGRQREEL